jgi:zinc/manganese transport system permease protein
MFAHDFVRNAYLAGTFIALASGMVGWLLVLRAQVFAADALSHVAFVGAIGAAVVGLDERVGLFVLTIAIASGMAGLGRRGDADDTVIGIVFAWILGIGILLITLLASSAQGGTGIAAANTLFGSIYSLSAAGSQLAALLALLVAVAVLVAFRPLLLSTLDSELAAVRGVRVRALAAAFLVAVAVVTAESTEAVGALLLLGLLAAPAGAAHRLTSRPYRGLALAAGLAVAATWGGLALSYAISSLPASSAIIGLAALSYGGATLVARWRSDRGPAGGPGGSRNPNRRRFLNLRAKSIPQRRGGASSRPIGQEQLMQGGVSSP